MGKQKNQFRCLVESEEDRRYTKPNLKLVNKANLDKLLKAEIYVNEADASVSAGTSSSLPTLREKEIKGRKEEEKEEKDEEEVVEIIQNTFKLDEMLNACSDQLDDERRRRTTAVQTLSKFEQDLADVRKKLQVEEQARKSAESALEGYQKQAEDQGNRLREANAELKKAQEQVLVLRKHLEETQKLRERAKKSRERAKKAKINAKRAMNEAEQRGYEVGIAETEKALRAEVLTVCRIYYAKTWNEALNRAWVEASFELLKPENVFYPEAIWPSVLLPHQANAPSSVINLNEEVSPHSFPPLGQPESTKEGLTPPGASPDKTTTVSKAETASQGFQ
ncbi:plectin-like [Quercus lobata]|uniref:plectin-like n=1 Tax=Quercus lobata TaxID=97700 RepID=UPI00124851D9|nr:plectin-like [Quercus lobata]